MLQGLLLIMNSATIPRRNTVSYHSARVYIPKFLEPISEVIPFTISWLGWWEVLISKGDFLIFMVSMNMNATNTPGR